MLQPAPSWPRPADPDAAARLRERFAELGAPVVDAAVLDALGGNSPYLADLALREADTLRDVLHIGPDSVIADILAALDAMLPTLPRPALAAVLRQAKRRAALAIALADLGGLWPLEKVTAALSNLAEAALRLCCAHLLRAAHDRGQLRLPSPDQPGRGSGWIVLGMGKLGARELNYSSDVDLILLYDPDRHPYHADGLGALFSRLARDLVSLMEARDADGYVFRTDLRLRPDPAATPPCVALPAALSYYESMGQNWERAAMIKARPVAADTEAGTRFLAEIRPFVWRRGLDFAAMADIHAMKARVDQHKRTALASTGTPAERLLGHDVKLGQGGIREIEFLAQTLQLVWGGRDPALRALRTLDALPALAYAGHLAPDAVAPLDVAYRALRAVEHRLQMVSDRQTHSLPATLPEMERFATFMNVSGMNVSGMNASGMNASGMNVSGMGEPDADTFARGLLAHMDQVRLRWAEVFDPVPDTGSGPTLDFTGVGDPPDTVAALRAMGFGNPGGVVAVVRGWRAGRLRALRSDRARALLNGLLPALLAALARQADPDAALMRLDALLSRLAAGVGVLSLFQRNPALLDRVAAVLGAAPSLADHLAAAPAALEGLLASPHLHTPPADALRAQLADSRALDDALAITRQAVRGEEFRLSVAQMEARMDADGAGLARTAMADAVLTALLPRVLADHTSRYGRVPGGGMAVVLLGKAGGGEMMAGSDLDLMLVYDHPADSGGSVGPRPLPASTWFIRAAHAYVAALTSPGPEGPLYAVDMRLRPSGNKGPVAVPLSGFVRYHQEDSWTWEHMALTRARVVAGPTALRRRVSAALDQALRLPRDAGRTRADAAAMRGRLLRDLPATGPWDVKLRPGGQMEVEFVAQVLQLVHGPANPRLFSPTTRTALHRLVRAGYLPKEHGEVLLQADRLWRTIQGMVRILVGRAPQPSLPAAAEAMLLDAAGGGPDLHALRALMDGTAEQVRAIFLHHIGDPEKQPMEKQA